MEALKAEAEYYQDTLEGIRTRIDELSKEEAK
jgi:hypothetical protein